MKRAPWLSTTILLSAVGCTDAASLGGGAKDAANDTPTDGSASDRAVTDASTSDASNRVCPASAPMDNAACSSSGLTCQYGHSPRSACNQLFACIGGVWEQADTGVCLDGGLADGSTSDGATEVCTPDDGGAPFAVKVAFVVDTSGSMAVTDPGQERAQAVIGALTRWQGYPNRPFGVIAFGSEIAPLTQDGAGAAVFTSSPNLSAITAGLKQAGGLTDYEGALAAVNDLIATDALASTLAERSRTKYVVVFFSDGTPDPHCSGEATDCSTKVPGGSGTCAAHEHCTIPPVAPPDNCTADYLICTVSRSEWSTFDPPVSPSLYPGLETEEDYNNSTRILHAVDQLVALKFALGLGDVELDTRFLFNRAVASNPLAAPFELDEAAGGAILTEMARHGGGTFEEFTADTQIEFSSHIGFASLQCSGPSDAGTTDSGKSEAGSLRDAASDGTSPCKPVVAPGQCTPAVIPISCFPAGALDDAGVLTVSACTAVCPTTTSTGGSYCSLLTAQDGGGPSEVECYDESCIP